MRIRHENTADYGVIAQLHYAAFKNHPQHAPGAEPTEQFITDRLRAAGALALSLVAEMDGDVAGHVACSACTLGGTGQGWMTLGPIGVLPALQGRGVGSALMRATLEELRARGAAGMILLGEPRFYGRFGFVQAPMVTFMGRGNPHMLALCFGGAQPRGELGLHPGFFEGPTE